MISFYSGQQGGGTVDQDQNKTNGDAVVAVAVASAGTNVAAADVAGPSNIGGVGDEEEPQNVEANA